MKQISALLEGKREYQRRKGYDADHDDAHVNGEIVMSVAKRYLDNYNERVNLGLLNTEIHIDHAIDDLANAGACIMAEMERLQRIQLRLRELEKVVNITDK